MLDAADEAAEDADEAAADEAAEDAAEDASDEAAEDASDDAVDEVADDSADESADEVSPSSPQAASAKQVQSIASASSRIVNFFMGFQPFFDATLAKFSVWTTKGDKMSPLRCCFAV